LQNGFPDTTGIAALNGIVWTGTFNITAAEPPNCCDTILNVSDNKTYGAMQTAITNYQGLLGGNGSLVTPYKIII
jgi:hypothetical protein